MLDPVSIGLAIKAMQTAYSGIQYCVEALADGKVQVQKIKKAAEDAQTIVKDVKSIWSILAGLFSGKPPAKPENTPSQSTAEPVAKAPPRAKEVYIRHIPTEAEIVQKFVDNVGDFYEHHIKLSEIYDTKSEEVYAMDSPNPRDILLLSQIKHELDGSFTKLSGMMRGASVPPQLGPLWDNFHEIYDRVTQQQQARRERERIRRQNETWQQDYRRRIRAAKLGYVIVMLVAGMWMTGLFFAL